GARTAWPGTAGPGERPAPARTATARGGRYYDQLIICTIVPASAGPRRGRSEPQTGGHRALVARFVRGNRRAVPGGPRGGLRFVRGAGHRGSGRLGRGRCAALRRRLRYARGGGRFGRGAGGCAFLRGGGRAVVRGGVPLQRLDQRGVMPVERGPRLRVVP